MKKKKNLLFAVLFFAILANPISFFFVLLSGCISVAAFYWQQNYT
jgi:hypothetical protein